MIKYLLLICLLLMACSAEETVVVEAVAHRGIGGEDNTIESSFNALNSGFTSIEVDVRLQGDTVVLAHDKTYSDVSYTLLEDFLIFASNNNVKVWLDIKETSAIDSAVTLIRRYGVKAVFLSTRKSDLAKVKSYDKSLITGQLITREEQIEDIQTEWVVIYHPFVERNFNKIKHLKIAAWTIKNQSEYDGIKEFLDAVITDVELVI